MKWNEGSFHDQWKGSSAASESILTYIYLLGRQINPNSTLSQISSFFIFFPIDTFYPYIAILYYIVLVHWSNNHVWNTRTWMKRYATPDDVYQINWSNFRYDWKNIPKCISLWRWFLLYLAIIFVFEYIYTYIIFLYYIMWKLSMKDTWCKFINFYTVYFRLCFSKGKRNYCQRQYSFVKNLSRSRKENLS